MNSLAGTIIKVLGLSIGLSLAIKHGFPLLPIPPSGTLALFLVMLPTCIVGILLGLRSRAIAPTE